MQFYQTCDIHIVHTSVNYPDDCYGVSHYVYDDDDDDDDGGGDDDCVYVNRNLMVTMIDHAGAFDALCHCRRSANDVASSIYNKLMSVPTYQGYIQE